MGVQGLWELLSPVGHRVSNEHVRNKVLAVDISIWLTQFIKAMRDTEGAQVRNAHLLGVFRRCIKLLFLSVRPVLIFDGATPAIKRRTLAGRRATRERHEAKLRRLAEKMLVNRMQLRLVGDVIKKRKEREIDAGEHSPIENSGRHRPSGFAEEVESENVVVEDEDRIEPVYKGENGDAPAGLKQSGGSGARELARQLEEADAVFAADLADEEEAMTRAQESEPFALPYDPDDIDDETLRNLPPDMQSEVLKQIKLQQRARHRERMMMQKHDPAQFSRTQIEGFLQNTALNRKIKSVRNALNVKSGASKRIASDSARQYVLEEKDVIKDSDMDGFDTEDSIDDELGGGVQGSSKGRGRNGNGPSDILVQLREKRDVDLQRTLVRQERRREAVRGFREKRSGVGWASRVLEGRGGLALGGQSALSTTVTKLDEELMESGDEFWEDGKAEQAEQDGIQAAMKSGGDESDDDDDDMEWEDGDDTGASNVINDGDYDKVEIDKKGRDVEEGEIWVRHAARAGVPKQSVVDLHSKQDDQKPQGKKPITEKIREGSADIDGPREEENGSPPQPENPKRRHSFFDLDAESEQDVDSNSQENLSPVIRSPVGPVCDRENEEDEEEMPEPTDQKRRLGFFDLDAVDSESDDCERKPVNASVSVGNHRSSPPGSDRKNGSLINQTPSKEVRFMPEYEISNIPADSDEGNAIIEKSGNAKGSRRKASEEEGMEIQMAIASSLEESVSHAGHEERCSLDVQQLSKAKQQCVASDGLGIAQAMDRSISGEMISETPALSVSNSQAVPKHHILVEQIEPEASNGKDTDDANTSRRPDISQIEKESDVPGASRREVQTVADTSSQQVEASVISTEQIQGFRDELEVEGRELQRQRTSHQGGAETVSEEMYAETRDLLKLFGIPYLEAPTEAEAQCAFLNTEHVVDGIITEDSDAFLFGARVVYRKLFAEGQFAEAYEASDIESKLGLDRDLLIRLAYLLGSDYTVGVRGVGVVNSMEILEAFPGEKGLEEFREWTKQVTVFDKEPEGELMTGRSLAAVRRRFCWKHRNMKRNWEIRPEFPNPAVAEAYHKPDVDRSTARFKWGAVDFAGLGKFCWEKFGWERERFDAAVGPLRKKLIDDRGPQQRRIDEFFKPHRFAKIKSERLQKAVKGIVGEEALELMANSPKVVPKGKKKRKVAAVTHVAVESDEEEEMMAAVEQAERELEVKRTKFGT